NLNDATALVTHVRQNRFKCVLSLLYNNAAVNRADSSGDSPLHWAVQSGNPSLVKALIIFDADVGVRNRAGKSPRCIAEKLPNQQEMVEIFDALDAIPPGVGL